VNVAELPFMPLYIGDYLRDTRHLSSAQHGAYLLLMFHYWSTGSLPDDDRQLANIAKLSLKEWRRHRPIIQAFFRDGWHHKRIDMELRRTIDIRAKRAAAGSKGGTMAAINRFRRR
jgi:uncharacterized protein YdaU (DUF1376 family)